MYNYRVVVADSDKAVTKQIADIIRNRCPFATVCGTFTSMRTLTEKVKSNAVDILVLDASLAGGESSDVIKSVLAHGVKTKVILLCDQCDFALAKKALKYGVTYFAAKPVDEHELLQYLEEIRNLFEDEKDEILGSNLKENSLRDLCRQSLYMLVKSNIPTEELLNNNNFKHLGLKSDNFVTVKFSVRQTVNKKIARTYSTMWRDMCEQKTNEIDVFCISENIMSAEFFVIVKSVTAQMAKTAVTGFAESTLRLMLSAYGFYAEYEIEGLENLCTDKAVDIEKISAAYVDALLTNNNKDLCEIRTLVASFENPENGKRFYLNILSRLENSLLIEATSLKAQVTELDGALLVKNLKAIEEEVIKSTLNQSEVVTRVKKYIANLQGSDFSLKSISEAVAYTPYYLSRIYKSETGESLSNYLFKCRINRAKELLLTGNYTVAEVAKTVGFENASYFSRAFKKETGRLPKQFSLTGK